VIALSVAAAQDATHKLARAVLGTLATVACDACWHTLDLSPVDTAQPTQPQPSCTVCDPVRTVLHEALNGRPA
jgi:hypothetical protein